MRVASLIIVLPQPRMVVGYDLCYCLSESVDRRFACRWVELFPQTVVVRRHVREDISKFMPMTKPVKGDAQCRCPVELCQFMRTAHELSDYFVLNPLPGLAAHLEARFGS